MAERMPAQEGVLDEMIRMPAILRDVLKELKRRPLPQKAIELLDKHRENEAEETRRAQAAKEAIALLEEIDRLRDVYHRFGNSIRLIEFRCKDKSVVSMPFKVAALVPLVIDKMWRNQEINIIGRYAFEIEVEFDHQPVEDVVNFLMQISSGNQTGGHGERDVRFSENLFNELFFKRDVVGSINALPVAIYFGLGQLADMIASEIAKVCKRLPTTRLAMLFRTDNDLDEDDILLLNQEEDGLNI